MFSSSVWGGGNIRIVLLNRYNLLQLQTRRVGINADDAEEKVREGEIGEYSIVCIDVSLAVAHLYLLWLIGQMAGN